MVNSPIRFMALSSSACTGSPLRCVERGVSIPVANRFLHDRRRSSREDHLRPTGATDRCTGSSRKSQQNDLTLCAPPSIAGPSLQRGLPAKPETLGKIVDEPSSPAFRHRPMANSNFLLKIIESEFRSSLGHFD